MKSTLKQSVNKHYAQQTLEEQQLDKLEALYTTTTDTPANNTPDKLSAVRKIYPWVTSIAATVLLAVSLLFVYLPIDNEQRILDIAQEVAKEHLHQNALEVSSRNFSVVQNYFSKLDFMPNVSSRFGDSSQLLGGRYCSIRNITAAQIRYQTTGTPNTLYQVSYDPEHFGIIPDISKGETPLKRHVKGVQMEMWVEKGLFMVGAKNIPVTGQSME